jgi:hypothetical protein
MKSSILSYVCIFVGVVLLLIGVYFLVPGYHPLRAYGSISAGAVISVFGIVIMFVVHPRL